jgi:NifU-like protein involved in Fe-S cluster formation
MGRNIIGATIAELREVRDAASRLLRADGEPPQGKWEDLKVLEPLRDYKARHASILLTFDAVVDALDQVEARRIENGG